LAAENTGSYLAHLLLEAGHRVKIIGNARRFGKAQEGSTARSDYGRRWELAAHSRARGYFHAHALAAVTGADDYEFGGDFAGAL